MYFLGIDFLPEGVLELFFLQLSDCFFQNLLEGIVTDFGDKAALLTA